MSNSSLASPSLRLPWKRFWCPTTGNLPLVDGGYLVDPRSEFGKMIASDVVPFEDLSQYPCLILLGEPGIGKSTAIEDELSIMEPGAAVPSEVVHNVNLKAYGSEDRLVRAVFEDRTFLDWLTGTHVLHLVLDSLDECLLRVNTVADLLLEELKRHRGKIPRLKFRIACRTAEWPANLETGLKELWGKERVGLYELAPLTREDVEVAAVAYAVDAASFSVEVTRVSAVPLAIKPVTLHFLLKTYRRDGRLPATRDELYLEGCRLLCEETSPSRRGAGLRGDLSADQRLSIASRIAAVMIFCNRSVIHTGVGEALDPEAELAVKELAGETESVGGVHVVVSEDSVRETLSSGLFSSRGFERLGWAHQTYAEFLAARYLIVHQMPMPQIRNLILHGEDSEHVIPQLQETTAWLAGMAQSVLDEVLRGDPQVLLRSDVASATDETRAKIVDAMLRLFVAEQLLDNDFDLRLGYQKLRHSGMQTQLEPYIGDRSRNFMVRRFAIDLAEACEIQSLQGLLADVSLDQEDLQHIRAQAAHAVAAIGDDATRMRLRALAEGRAGEDPDDELKGYGLRALWPKLITVHELFGLVTPQKKPNLYGAYAGFLSRDLLSHLRPVDLPVALEWAARRPARYDPFDKLGTLADEIIVQAWDHLESEHVLHPFAEAVLARFEEHAGVTRRIDRYKGEALWSSDDSRRLILAEALVPRLSAKGTEPARLIFGDTPLFAVTDIPWMVDHLIATVATDQRQVWAKLIRILFLSHAPQPPHVDLLVSAMVRFPELGRELEGIFEPVDISSKKAEDARAALREMHEWRHPEPPLLDPPPQKRVENLLDKCESGEPQYWWMVNREMTLELRSSNYATEFEPDLTQLPVWKAADSHLRGRIVKTAKGYLLTGDPCPDEWLGKNVFHFPAAAGYRALLLLSQQDTSAYAALPEEVWQKWVPIILDYPTQGAVDDAELRLAHTAYTHVPDKFIEILWKLIDVQNEKGDYLSVPRRIALCWDDRMKDAITEKLSSYALKPNCLKELLDNLLEHGSDAARGYAESLIPTPPPMVPPERDRSLKAAESLAEHTSDAGWRVVWPAIQSNKDWGEQFVSTLAHHHDHSAGNITRKLAEAQVADFYEWLATWFPRTGDPEENSGMHQVSTREAIASFREGVLADLQRRGTAAACQEIERLIRRFPHLAHLKWALVHARQIMLRHTWTPPQPHHLLKLAGDPNSRLVESGEQLLAVVLDSLQRWEQKLQGTPPAAFRVWDQVAKSQQRPKNEDKLSDEVTIHLTEDLRERGIVANREVVIRHGEKPGGKGERTDIYVNAVRHGDRPDTFDTITVIIETKGCWNDKLDTDMQGQLRDRYLKDNRCQHGIYLVGWFVCPQWDATDGRLSAVRISTLDEARHRFESQAEALSHDGIILKAFVANTALR